MLVLSHRGYHASAPENTIEAFALAEQMKVDGIETDLRVTRDGRLILFHDRIVPDGRAIESLTQAEITAVVGYPVPEAEEAVAGFDDLLWNLEIKVPAALEPSIALVKRYCERDQKFLITSFWHSVVDAWQARSRSDQELSKQQNISFGLLTADRPLSLETLLGSDSRRFDAIVWYYEILDPPLLSEARALGIANYVYGVKTVEDHRRCIELDLDAVITDHPQMMAQARLELKKA